MAPPVFVHGVGVGDTGTSSALVQSFTTGVGETYLVVAQFTFLAANPATVASVTFGATPITERITLADTGGPSIRGYIHSAVVPASTTADVTVTWAGNNSNAVVAIAGFSGVNSIGTAVSGKRELGAGSGDVSATAVVTGGTLLFGCCGNAQPDTFTKNAAQTELIALFQDGASQVEMHVTSGGVGGTTPTWNGDPINDSAIVLALPLEGVDDGSGSGGALTRLRLHKTLFGF